MKREGGSASVVVAAIVAMVVVLALGAADVARVIAAAGRAQTAADAAALAAAQELAITSGLVPQDVAAEYATLNGAALVDCVCAAGTFEANVEVRVDVGDLLLFDDDRAVLAEARAIVKTPSR